MAKLQGVTARRMANQFVEELFKKYRAPHVRQVASWIGFIVYGVEKLNEGAWDIPRQRQLRFVRKGKTFVAGFDHAGGGRITFREVRGRERGPVAATIKNLNEAREFYEDPESFLVE